MSNVFFNSQSVGLSGNLLYVSKSAGSDGSAVNMSTRGRLSGDLFVTGRPNGVAYGVKLKTAYPDVIVYNLVSYFGEVVVIQEASASLNLPRANEQGDFPASNPYYLDTIGKIADVGLQAVNTLGAIGAITAIVSGAGAPVGGAMMLARSALPVLNKYVPAVIASSVVSASAKLGADMLSTSGLSKGSINITPNTSYLICVADIAQSNPDIVDLSGGSNISNPTRENYVNKYDSAYQSYDRTADYNENQQRQTNTSPVAVGVGQVTAKAWAEAQIIIKDTFNQAGIPHKDDNDPSWNDAKEIFESPFFDAMAEIIKNNNSNFNDTKLKLDDLKTKADLVEQLAQSNENSKNGDSQASDSPMNETKWIKLFNRYFLKTTDTLQMSLLPTENKADLMENNPNFCLTNELFYRSLDGTLQDPSNTEGV